MTGDTGSALRVIDAPDRHRYEIVRDGTVVGYAAYQKTDRLIVFTHTEVDPSLEGQGVGGLLIRGALDHVRTLGLASCQSVPSCKPGWPGTATTPIWTTGGHPVTSQTERSILGPARFGGLCRD